MRKTTSKHTKIDQNAITQGHNRIEKRHGRVAHQM